MPDGKVERFANDDFEIELPGRWTVSQEPTHYEFLEEERGEQLTVMVLAPRAPLDDERLVTAATELVAVRQRAARALGDGVRFGEVHLTSGPGAVDADYTGDDPDQQVQFAVVVRGRPARIVTASYLKYQAPLGPDDFAARSREVLGGLRVK